MKLGKLITRAVGLVATALASSFAFADQIMPGANAAANVTAINGALSAAGQGDTVELGEGTFEINATLSLANGVTLKGQGWEKTIIKQTEWGKRCVLIDGGSTLTGVTLTGGQSFGNYEQGSGAGAQINDGAISWCCISNNWVASGNNSHGAGVLINQGRIDHSIIADNRGGNYSVGGGIGAWDTSGPIIIDTCLIYGNTAKDNAGGIGFNQYNADVTIRNTTITANTSEKGGGGVRVNSTKFVVVNTIISGNTVGGVEKNTEFTPAASSSNNLIGVDPKFANAAAGDFHLTANSKDAVGKGVWYEGIGDDLDGVQFGNPPSIGCYDFIMPTDQVVSPEFDPASGTVFYPSTNVTLTCVTEGAVIYYTTDDSDPTEQSAVYVNPIEVTETTTIKARAYRLGYTESDIVTATYAYEEPVPPVIGTVSVLPFATAALVTGSVTSLGNFGATACDVYFAFGTDEESVGEARKFAEGVTGDFSFAVPGLASETDYFYVLSVSNNASVVTGASASGSFRTTAAGGAIEPIAGDPAMTRLVVQAMIDAAAAGEPAGTVILADGTFEISDELRVWGGVTLAGQSWTNTVIKQVTYGKRVATVADGSTLAGVTITGGNIGASWFYGAGLLVTDGTVSSCRITDNKCTGNNCFGGGIQIDKGSIDHTIVDGNVAGGSTSGGGGIYCNTVNPIVIDTCLLFGNSVPVNSAGKGGGIFLGNGGANMTILNTTIADNSAGKGASGGGLYFTSSKVKLVNCIATGNTVDGETSDLVGTPAEGSSNNFIGGNAKFVDSANGDYHLRGDSPAADAGQWYDGIPNDLDGVARYAEGMAAGCYECTLVDPGLIKLSPLTVTTTTTSATVSGTIESLGEGTSATVTLFCGPSAEELAEVAKLTEVTAEFSLTAAGLTHATRYAYVLTVANDAERETEESGEFLTQYDPEQTLLPSDDPAVNVATLNAVFVSAAQTQATVTLGEGVFEINDELIIAGGITVVGQGWEKTTLRQTAYGKRVATVKDGSSLVGVTVTGGHVVGNYSYGGGLMMLSGTVSWCCITNNTITGNNIFGAGVNIADGATSCTIDHSIIVRNKLEGMSGHGAGIGGDAPWAGVVTVDTCLIYGNEALDAGNNGGHGAGIGFNRGISALTVRSTTITGNAGAASGAGIRNPAATTLLANSIVAQNTVKGEGIDPEAVEIDGTLATGSSGNLIGEDPLFKDAANGDYHLRADSPAVSIGTWYEGISGDLDGKRRFRRVDAGCYKIDRGMMIMIK